MLIAFLQKNNNKNDKNICLKIMKKKIKSTCDIFVEKIEIIYTTLQKKTVFFCDKLRFVWNHTFSAQRFAKFFSFRLKNVNCVILLG